MRRALPVLALLSACAGEHVWIRMATKADAPLAPADCRARGAFERAWFEPLARFARENLTDPTTRAFLITPGGPGGARHGQHIAIEPRSELGIVTIGTDDPRTSNGTAYCVRAIRSTNETVLVVYQLWSWRT